MVPDGNSHQPRIAREAKSDLEASLLEAIWHAWLYDDLDATAALTDALRTARNQSPAWPAPWQAADPALTAA